MSLSKRRVGRRTGVNRVPSSDDNSAHSADSDLSESELARYLIVDSGILIAKKSTALTTLNEQPIQADYVISITHLYIFSALRVRRRERNR